MKSRRSVNSEVIRLTFSQQSVWTTRSTTHSAPSLKHSLVQSHAAFVLYRFQILSTALETHANDLRDQYSEEVDLVLTNSYVVKGDFDKFLDYLTTHPIDVTGSDEMDAYIAHSLSQLKRLLRLKTSLLRHLYFAIALTVILITVSIFVLMVTPTLGLHPDVRSYAFMAAFVWVAACFVSYVFLIRKSLA